MRLKNPHIAAFTLIEIIVVIILLGIVASFSIPNFSRAVNRARGKDAVSSLEMIREAVNLYISRENGNVPPALADINAINSTLNVSIIQQQGNTYQCLVANIYTCQATNTDGWQVSFQLDTNNGIVFCSIAGCPTI